MLSWEDDDLRFVFIVSHTHLLSFVYGNPDVYCSFSSVDNAPFTWSEFNGI